MTEVLTGGKLEKLERWLEEVASADASDLHVGAGRRPSVRVSGALTLLGNEVVTAEEVERICIELTPEHRRPELEKLGTTDFAFPFGNDRYRASIFRQRGTYAMVLRRIPQTRMSFEQIGAPPVMRALTQLPRGLILVTGPTGSGKTTTLATLVHEINASRAVHIMTLEDPIEFIHEGEKAVINQREIGEDVSDFTEALRRVLRQDPDVILVGEMRDLETTSAAISAAETGHLVLGTLHTTGASRTVDRIIDQYPTHQMDQVKSQLSVSLQAVISQVLLRKADGKGRVAAFEVMIRNSAIENHIRKGETFKIPSVIQTQRRLGMQLLDDHLLELTSTGAITKESAIAHSQMPSDLRQRLEAV